MESPVLFHSSCNKNWHSWGSCAMLKIQLFFLKCLNAMISSLHIIFIYGKTANRVPGGFWDFFHPQTDRACLNWIRDGTDVGLHRCILFSYGITNRQRFHTCRFWQVNLQGSLTCGWWSCQCFSEQAQPHGGLSGERCHRPVCRSLF